MSGSGDRAYTLADLIVGANCADPNGSNSGASYVVFGKASGFGTLDGTNRRVIDLTTLSGDDTAGRVLLIFIDDLHFEPEMTPHVRRLLQDIVDHLVHEGDLVARLRRVRRDQLRLPARARRPATSSWDSRR